MGQTNKARASTLGICNSLAVHGQCRRNNHWVELLLDPVVYILEVVALVVFVGEVSTVERPKLYLAFLRVDVYYSFSCSHVITRFVISDPIWAASVVEWLAAFVMAILVAYYGKLILFRGLQPEG